MAIRTLIEYIQRGKLPAITAGKSYFIVEKDLFAFQRSKPGPKPKGD